MRDLRLEKLEQFKVNLVKERKRLEEAEEFTGCCDKFLELCGNLDFTDHQIKSRLLEMKYEAQLEMDKIALGLSHAEDEFAAWKQAVNKLRFVEMYK